MKTIICDILNIEYPVIQGGMAWIADHRLAAAVSNAGGLGIIAAANAPAEYVKQEIYAIRELTDKPFGINVMLMSPYADEIARLAVNEHVPVVTTGAGNPEKYFPMWKEAGIKLLPVVASVGYAVRLESKGADAIICEGMEAGGHIGELTTMAMVPQVRDAVNIPVIAAGGIADGRGMAAVFALGAEGIQMGTRFLAASECPAHDEYKNRIIKARAIDSVVTGRCTGHPVRSVRNQMTRKYLELEKEYYRGSYEKTSEMEDLAAGSLRKAVVEGDIVNGSVMAGQIVGLVNSIKPCREIIRETVNQAEEIISRLQDRFV